MPKRHYEVDPRILTVFFFVAIPFLAFGALVVMNLARGHLQNATGQTLEQRAGEARQLVERYVLGQFSHLHLIALDPQVRAAVNAPPRESAPDELRRLDQAWAAGDAALVASVAGSPLAARLREVGQTQPALRLLQVVDARGRLIATTARGGRMWNGDTAWFRAFGDTEIGGRPYVVDVVAPPGGAGAMFEIDVPVRDGTDDICSGPCALSTTRRISTACSPPCASGAPGTPSSCGPPTAWSSPPTRARAFSRSASPASSTSEPRAGRTAGSGPCPACAQARSTSLRAS